MKQYLISDENPASEALVKCNFLFTFSKSDVFISFVCSFKAMEIAPFNEDTMHLNEFHKTFFKCNAYQTFNLSTLNQSLTGYLFLNLIENNNTHKKLEKCIINNDKYYILNGTYIAPFASQLLLFN